MNKKIFGGIAIAVTVAFNVSLSMQTPNQASQLVLANVEALADEGDDKICPDYNYVPHRYIESVIYTGKVTCTTSGQITAGGITISGSYEAGKEYEVSYMNKNCDGQQKNACCDQRQVGASKI